MNIPASQRRQPQMLVYLSAPFSTALTLEASP
jgi:hypothetical protein